MILFIFIWCYCLQEKKEIVNNCELNDEKSVNCKKWIKMFSFKDLFTATEQQLLHTVSCGNFRNIFHTEQTQTHRWQVDMDTSRMWTPSWQVVTDTRLTGGHLADRRMWTPPWQVDTDTWLTGGHGHLMDVDTWLTGRLEHPTDRQTQTPGWQAATYRGCEAGRKLAE